VTNLKSKRATINKSTWGKGLLVNVTYVSPCGNRDKYTGEKDDLGRWQNGHLLLVPSKRLCVCPVTEDNHGQLAIW